LYGDKPTYSSWYENSARSFSFLKYLAIWLNWGKSRSIGFTASASGPTRRRSTKSRMLFASFSMNAATP